MNRSIDRGLCFRLLSMSLVVLPVLSANVARAGNTVVDINSYVNANVLTYTNGSNYPGGGTVLTNAGVSFVLADYPGGGTGVIQTPNQSNQSAFDISVNIADPRAVYTLINSSWGEFEFTAGAIEFKATGGLDYMVNLIEGQDIRDHNNDSFNNVIGQGALGPLYINSFYFGGGVVRFDEQEFVLPSSFNTATLTDIILHGYGDFPNGTPFLTAATVASALPEPSSLLLACVGLGTAALWGCRRIRRMNNI
jgi:hypothetical protein